MFLPNLSWNWTALGATLVAVCFCIGSHAAFGDLHPVTVVKVENQPSYQVERLFAGRVVGSQRADIGFEFAGKVVSLNAVSYTHLTLPTILRV